MENVSRERDAAEESSKIKTKVANGFGNVEVIVDLGRHNFRCTVGKGRWIGKDSRVTCC